jgi:hypothetical protein
MASPSFIRYAGKLWLLEAEDGSRRELGSLEALEKRPRNAAPRSRIGGRTAV